jgi:hypothetical protein
MNPLEMFGIDGCRRARVLTARKGARTPPALQAFDDETAFKWNEPHEFALNVGCRWSDFHGFTLSETCGTDKMQEYTLRGR